MTRSDCYACVLMSVRTRTEIGALVKKAQDHLRKAQELHVNLQTLMHRLAHEGIKNKRKAPRRTTKGDQVFRTRVPSVKPDA